MPWPMPNRNGHRTWDLYELLDWGRDTQQGRSCSEVVPMFKKEKCFEKLIFAKELLYDKTKINN